MKTNRIYIKITILISLFLLLTTWENISAAFHSVQYNNWCCGGTAAIGELRALAYNSYQGSCDITSKTSPLTTINIIGWTTWQCANLDNTGNVINGVTRPARATPPANSVSDFTPVNYCNYAFSPPKCGLVVRASGVHDFNHTGASSWRPSHYVTGP